MGKSIIYYKSHVKNLVISQKQTKLSFTISFSLLILYLVTRRLLKERLWNMYFGVWVVQMYYI